jgi:phosphoserine phosphatase
MPDADDLKTVLDLTRRMAATSDLGSLLNLIVERSIQLLRAERSSLFLYDPQSNELFSRVAIDAGEIRFPADRGIAGATIQTGQTIHVPDAYADDRFNPEIDRRTGFHTRNILSVPLRDYESQLVGVLQVLNKTTGDFQAYDVQLAESLAAQAGVSLQRARLLEHYERKKQLERAMSIARDIQRRCLPQTTPELEGFEVAGFSQAADQAGGDAFDYLALPDRQWGLTVADASGHGIGPALVVAETRAMLRAVCRQGAPVDSVLQIVNDLLARDLDGRFVTCFLGTLDLTSASLTYASAGHGPLLFYRRAEDAFDERSATGPPLGMFPEITFGPADRFDFAPGDLAAVFTDGFFEASPPGNDHDDMFGLERVCQCIRQCRDAPLDEAIACLHRQVMDYTGLDRPEDDLTVVLLRRRSAS